ncbi:MAG: zinc-dependent metalloprotease [Candidatus Aminicenantes bacterium]|nr:zinc-dependent metalloprotease [Candidatus Aminicenantes bacterium]
MKRFVFLLCLVIAACSLLCAQPQSISKKTAGMEKYPGYFTFYWDAKEGKIWLEIDKFNMEFLYVNSLRAGVGSNNIGLDRNQLGRTRIVKFERVGPKVLLVQPNYSFRAISDNPDERRAVEEAFAQSVIWGFPVEVEGGGRIIVDASRFFLRDAHNVIGSLRRRNQGNYKLDITRSAIYLPMTKNFPYNSEVEALLTFTSENPGSYVRQVAPDPGSITVRQHHSFIRLPDDNYKPRTYDPRANFSGMNYMDYSTPVDESIVKRFISRHRLKKKNPSAKISDPVTPIVYYVDRGVPEPIRSALVEGASWWNEAFEAIGYRNAFQAKVLPEGADPMDVRYNLINWIHRSTRGWSYGSSVRDPRTGEIIKGHVALGSLRIRQDFLIAEGLVADYREGKKKSKEMLEMALARIRQLSCHEVGHTLGLGHNYASSVNDRASVMDYPHPLVKIKKDGSLDLSDAYDTGIGEWDKVSISYGYQDFPVGVDEEKELKAILNRAFSRGLYFLSGQDAGSDSAHPLANVWDNGKDPVDELERMMKIRSIALKNFSERKIRTGAPMATLEEVLVPVYMFHRYQVEAAASVLGGLYYNHKLRGDVQKNPEIVSASEQRRALDSLLRTIQPESLAIDQSLLNIIPPRPPGYRQTPELFSRYTGPTFDPLAAAETAANLTIGLVLQSGRAARLVDYHSRNKTYPGLSDVLDKLILSTWKSAKKAGFKAEIQRVVNNVLLYNLMMLAADEEAPTQVRAIASLKLEELRRWLDKRMESIKDEDQRAHYFYACSQIKLFQENPEKIKLAIPLRPPAGAPIGMKD